MAAEFHNILLPPQTLDSLDAWGSLDSLPLSLDSPAWEAAGIYRLTIRDSAKSGGSLRGVKVTPAKLATGTAKGQEKFSAKRSRKGGGSSAAKSGNSFKAVRSRKCVCGEKATSGNRLTSRRSRLGGASTTATTTQTYGSSVRVRVATCTIGAKSGAIYKASISRPEAFAGVTNSGERFKSVRVRTVEESLVVTAGGSISSGRTRGVTASGLAQVDETFSAARSRSGVASAKTHSGETFSCTASLAGTGELTTKTSESIASLRERKHIVGFRTMGLEEIDRFGALDDLPWSLDDVVWGKPASAGGRLSGYSSSARNCEFSAVSSEAVRIVRVRDSLLSSAAETRDYLRAIKLRPETLLGSAYSSGALATIRSWSNTLQDKALVSESVSGLRVRPATGSLSGQTSGSLLFDIDKTAKLDAVATSSDSLLSTRTRLVSLEDRVQGSEKLTANRIRMSLVGLRMTSLEELDRFGSLDDLPQSLDDVVWGKPVIAGESLDGCFATAREGAFSAVSQSSVRSVRVRLGNLGEAETAKASESFASVRIRTKTANFTAISSDSTQWQRSRYSTIALSAHAVGRLSLANTLYFVQSEPAKSGESFTASRVRPHSSTLSAVSGQSIAALRIRQNVTSGTAKGSENVTVLRVRPFTFAARASFAGILLASLSKKEDIQGAAYSGASLEGQRIRTAIIDLSATTSASINGASEVNLTILGKATSTSCFAAKRLAWLACSGSALADDTFVGHILGCEWSVEKTSSAPVWEQKNEALNTWVQKLENVADWAAWDVSAQGWIQKQGGMATWR